MLNGGRVLSVECCMLNCQLLWRMPNSTFNIQHSTFLPIQKLNSFTFPSQQTHKLLAGVQ